MLKENKHSQYSKDIYSKVLEYISDDECVSDEVLKIGLVGSVNDDESVDTWSDLDILFILKCDATGNIKTSTLLRLRELNKKISSIFADVEISFLTHTYDDLEKYVSFGYLENYKFASFDVDNDFINFTEYIDQIIEKRGIKNLIRKRYTIYHLRHFRFNLIRKVLLIRDTKGAIKQIVDKIIETMILVSIYNDENIKGKKDRLSLIRELVDDQDVLSIYEESFKNREQWAEISFVEDDLGIWLDKFIKIENYLLEKHMEDTPEELININ